MISRLFFVTACAAVVVVFISNADAQDKKYDDLHDHIDVEAILKNDEERDRYYACFMDTGPCHNEAAVFFKKHAPEAMVTSCKYCTDKQLQMFEKIVSWFIDHKPKEWNELIEKTINDARKMGLQFP